MNARTVMPLAMVTALCLVSLTVSAADDTAPTEAGLPDNPAQAKARAALYADEAVAATPESKPEPAPVVEPTAQPMSELGAVSTAAGPLPDTEAQASARAAIRADETEPVVAEGIETAPVAAAAVEQATPKRVSKPKQASQKADLLTRGIEAPALPTSASQQAQLEALLQQYRADAISASDYHARRAEILAGK